MSFNKLSTQLYWNCAKVHFLKHQNSNLQLLDTSTLHNYTNDLILKDGIYYSNQESEISYPKEGNNYCFQIEQDSFWFNHRNNCIIEAVKKFAQSNFFFDIGGGNGFVAKGLEENGIKTALIEPGIGGCLNAKKRGLTHIICSTLENASFKENSISSIGLFDVVEHIEDDSKFLKYINHYLLPGGLVFITVPAYQMLWSNEDNDAGHFRRYTISSMTEVLEKSGFVVKYSSYIFSILPIPVFLFRTIPSRLGLNKKSNQINKHVNEHKSKKGLLSKLLDIIWKFELNRIKSGNKIPFGGSCFIVAEKSC